MVRDLEQGRTARLRVESARRLAGVLRLDRQQTGGLGLAAQRNGDIAAEAAAPGDEVAAPGDVAKVRIGVLGPLAAWRSGVPVTLGPPLQRAVLGLLALHPSTGLSRSAIIDVLWRDDPPPTAVPMLQSYISRLRRLLGPVCPLTANSGYRLQPLACDLDLVAFERLVKRARVARATGELAVACKTYEEALALWRGDPLADAEVLRDHPAIAQLCQRRADAVTSYAEAASAAGSPDRALRRQCRLLEMSGIVALGPLPGLTQGAPLPPGAYGQDVNTLCDAMHYFAANYKLSCHVSRALLEAGKVSK